MKNTLYLVAIVSACAAVGSLGLTACTVTTVEGSSDASTPDGTRDAGNDADTGSSTKADTGADTGPATCSVAVYKDTTCDPCLNAKCCAATSACFTAAADAGAAGSDCNQLDDCIGGCIANNAGTPCQDVCRQSHPDSVAAYDAFQTCATASCKTECE